MSANEVCRKWSDCGCLSSKDILSGELKIIEIYMLENNLPPHFLRVVFEMGLSAYLSIQGKIPEHLPQLFPEKTEGQN